MQTDAVQHDYKAWIVHGSCFNIIISNFAAIRVPGTPPTHFMPQALLQFEVQIVSSLYQSSKNTTATIEKSVLSISGHTAH